MASKVLVADESSTILKIVAMAFESEDVEVKGVADGKQALSALEEFAPDVVLADVDMPGLSGVELSRKIKTSPATQNIRVILLTSDFEEFDDAEFQHSGAEDHIAKPFKSEEIVAKVNDVLSGKTPARTLPIEEKEEKKAAGEAEPAAVELSADDLIDELLDEAPAESETVMELSAEDMQEESEEAPQVMELSAEDLEETDSTPEVMELSAEDMNDAEAAPPLMELSAEDLEDIANTPDPAPVVENADETYILSGDDEEEFDESRVPTGETSAIVEPSNGSNPSASETPEITDENDPEFILGEKRRSSESLESLDQAFQTVSRQPETSAPTQSASASASDDSRPNLIRDAQTFMVEQDAMEEITPGPVESPGGSPGTFAEKLDAATTDHALRLLEASLDRNVKKEIEGLSDTIVKTVREVVQQVAPEIVRSVIREEIEQIRKSSSE